MILSETLSKKKFAIYGIGATGSSVIRYFRRLRFKNFYVWDDSKIKRSQFRKITSIKKFSKKLNKVDYIILSPGIKINRTRLKKQLLKNKSKIITDLDLFYMQNPNIRSIVVTGTNGKSTTCKVIEHLLKKNNFNVKLCGNIGKPILNIKKKSKKTLFIIEASSFQLAYSRFVKPNYALILNITRDHLDWHGSMKAYVNAKFKIFSLQGKDDLALLSDKKLIKKFKKNKNMGRLKYVSLISNKKIRSKIQNSYLKSKANEQNISFAYKIAKIFNIKDKAFINSLKTFKGLPHRNEVFYQRKKITFIDDSKATSFESSKFALQSNKNIFWIVGGLPKSGDKFFLHNIKRNIIKSYIIGKHVNFFKKKLLADKINFEVSKTLNNAIKNIFYEIKKMEFNKEIKILLSPASASYDQYKNFEERGKDFKKLVKLYGKNFF